MKRNAWKAARGSAGFTLVELIVVIAILGILAGIGTVGYSGYVRAAHRGADEQLAQQVKYALELAAVDGSLGEGGAVVLTTEDPQFKTFSGGSLTDAGENSAVGQAVLKAFGSLDSLQLAYDGWDSAGVGDVSLAFSGSSFGGKQGELLGDIQNLTNAVKDMLASGADTEAIMALMGGTFGEYVKDTLKIESTDPEYAQKVANAATLFVANQVSGLTDPQNDAISAKWTANEFDYLTLADYNAYRDGTDDQKKEIKQRIITEMIGTYGSDGTGLSTLGAMATYYANVEAMVQSVCDEESIEQETRDAFYAAFKDINFSGVSDAVSAAESSDEVTQAAINAVYDAMADGYIKMYGVAADAALSGKSALSAAITGYGSTSGAKDAKAYSSTLGAVNESADVIGSDLSKGDLYGDGTVEDLLNGYLSAGEALDGVENGIAVIAVLNAAEGAGVYNIVAYPVDYVS